MRNLMANFVPPMLSSCSVEKNFCIQNPFTSFLTKGMSMASYSKLRDLQKVDYFCFQMGASHVLASLFQFNLKIVATSDVHWGKTRIVFHSFIQWWREGEQRWLCNLATHHYHDSGIVKNIVVINIHETSISKEN